MNAIHRTGTGRTTLAAVGLVLLLAAPGGLEAREKTKGAWVAIQGIDGLYHEGELLSVRGKNLLLMNYSLGGITLSVDDIARVIIEKGPKTWQGAGIGLLTGAALGASIGFLDGDDKGGWFSMTKGEKAVLGSVTIGVLGTLVGAMAGASTQTDEYVVLPRNSPDRRLEILKKLGSLSRTGVYLPED